MFEKPDQDPPKAGEIFATTFGNLFLAFAASFLVSKLMGMLWPTPGVILGADLIVFFTIMYADPISAIRNGKSRRDCIVKLAIGFAIAVLVAVPMVVSFGGTSEEKAATVASEAVGATDIQGLDVSFLWTFLPIFLIVPLVFMGPLAEKALKRGQDDAPVTSDDLQISATFPIYMMATMVLNLSVPGALWLLGASLPVAGAVMVGGTLLCVLEVWTAEPDELIDNVDRNEWGPRAETAQEAWTGLRKGLKQSFASALFLGSMIYISIQLAVPFFPDVALAEEFVLTFIMEFLLAVGVVLISSLVLIGLGVLVQVLAAYSLGRSQGADPLTIVELVKQSQMRLLAGGMHWVRPDLDTD